MLARHQQPFPESKTLSRNRPTTILLFHPTRCLNLRGKDAQYFHIHGFHGFNLFNLNHKLQKTTGLPLGEFPTHIPSIVQYWWSTRISTLHSHITFFIGNLETFQWTQVLHSTKIFIHIYPILSPMRSLGILPVGISHITKWPCPLIQFNQTCKINHWDTNKHAENSSQNAHQDSCKKENLGVQDKIPSKK